MLNVENMMREERSIEKEAAAALGLQRELMLFASAAADRFSQGLGLEQLQSLFYDGEPWVLKEHTVTDISSQGPEADNSHERAVFSCRRMKNGVCGCCLQAPWLSI